MEPSIGIVLILTLVVAVMAWRLRRTGIERVPPTTNDGPPGRTGLVTVLATLDNAELLVAKSLLEGAEIPYYAKGETAQSLFAGGPNLAMGPVEIQVPAALEAEARRLLEDPEAANE